MGSGESFSERLNRAMRQACGITVEAREKDEGNRQMTDLIRRAVDQGSIALTNTSKTEAGSR